ncbi:hypothetical protein JXR93_10480, partial [bacterium]|nr:hypothetical protein [bacterium]
VLKNYVLIPILSIFYLFSCGGNSAFKDERSPFKNVEAKAKVAPFYWISFASNGNVAVERSEKMAPKYYTLLFYPEKNIMQISSIAGNLQLDTKIPDSSNLPEVESIAEFNFYKVFFKTDIPEKLKIMKQKGNVQNMKFNIKVMEQPEKQIYDSIVTEIENYFRDGAIKAKGTDDFKSSCNFFVSSINNLEYKNNYIKFDIDVVFLNLKWPKIDYAAYLDVVEDVIEKAITEERFPEAEKYAQIYLPIAPNKIKYYEYIYQIHEKKGDKMGSLMDLVAMFNESSEEKAQKDILVKFRDIYVQNRISKKDLRKIDKLLDKEYKEFTEGKKTKDEFIETLKSIIIDYSL